jgi:photosystem II stability/assembly factor-like uncharacterized protein
MYTGVATLTETATPGHYMYKSSDGGVSWSPVNSLTEHRGIHKLAFDPANPDTLFVCVGSNYGHNPNKDIALYKSTDAAQTWTKLCDFADSRGCMQTFVIDPDNSNNMWVGFFSTASGVYKSEDGGLTWSAMNGPHGAMTQNSRIFYFKPTLYFADGGNIYNSNDRGATWNYVLGVPSMVNWIFEGMTSTTTASAQRRAVSRAGSSTSMIYAASASGLFSISGAAAAGNGRFQIAISQRYGQRRTAREHRSPLAHLFLNRTRRVVTELLTPLAHLFDDLTFATRHGFECERTRLRQLGRFDLERDQPRDRIDRRSHRRGFETFRSDRQHVAPEHLVDELDLTVADVRAREGHRARRPGLRHDRIARATSPSSRRR